VSAQVKDYHGNGRCVLRLFDAADGQELDLATATPERTHVTLDANGRPTVYIYDDQCVVRVSGPSPNLFDDPTARIAHANTQTGMLLERGRLQEVLPAA
jgi:hypothetical protein